MNNYEPKRVENLPDIMPPHEIQEQFEQLLLQVKIADSESSLLLLKELFELSDKQWHTYTLLPPGLLNQIDSILINLWNENSLENTEILLGIVAYLGLTKTFEKVKSALDGRLLTTVRQEILEAIEEFGATVADPYSGLHKDDL